MSFNELASTCEVMSRHSGRVVLLQWGVSGLVTGKLIRRTKKYRVMKFARRFGKGLCLIRSKYGLLVYKQFIILCKEGLCGLHWQPNVAGIVKSGRHGVWHMAWVSTCKYSKMLIDMSLGGGKESRKIFFIGKQVVRLVVWIEFSSGQLVYKRCWTSKLH